MNIARIFAEIERVDPEIYDRVDERRGVIKNFMRGTSRLAAAAVPVALGGLFNKAYGQKVSTDVLEVLNFALTLEHLESRFYQTAVGKAGLVPAKDKINVIRDHEVDHVRFLQQAIGAAGGMAVAEGKYDFTAKGLFPQVFSNYKQFCWWPRRLKTPAWAPTKARPGCCQPRRHWRLRRRQRGHVELRRAPAQRRSAGYCEALPGVTWGPPVCGGCRKAAEMKRAGQMVRSFWFVMEFSGRYRVVAALE